MKILHINTSDAGGAAGSCMRLHLGLLGQGIQSKVLVMQLVKRNVPECHLFHRPASRASLGRRIASKSVRLLRETGFLSDVPPDEQEQRRQAAFIAARPPGLEFFSYPYSNCDLTESDLYHEADIVNLHWVAGFLDWPSFFAKVHKPVVWTLHDQNPFCGGEHYRERFYGMDEDGFPVPRTYSLVEKSEEAQLIQIKHQCLAGVSNLTIVTPSRWMFQESRESALLGRFPHHHIPYGVPTSIFRPLDREACRDLLGLPQEKTLLLFVADSIRDKRKGYAYLQKALSALPPSLAERYALAAIGDGATVTSDGAVFELGRIFDERLMAAAYNAADLFIIPSLEDNLPNTVLESLACGTPVLGFPAGGIPDLVQDGINGMLASEISAPALAEAIQKFLLGSLRYDRSAIAEEMAAKYTLDIQAARYMKVYSDLLSPEPSRTEPAGMVTA